MTAKTHTFSEAETQAMVFSSKAESAPCSWCNLMAELYDVKPQVVWFECPKGHLSGYTRSDA